MGTSWPPQLNAETWSPEATTLPFEFFRLKWTVTVWPASSVSFFTSADTQTYSSCWPKPTLVTVALAPLGLSLVALLAGRLEALLVRLDPFATSDDDEPQAARAKT